MPTRCTRARWTAGAAIVIDIVDEDYGGRGFTCRDLEGHIWSIGTYDPLQHNKENPCHVAVHFEIQASNPQALIDYYSGLFGWSFNKWEGGDYWMIHTGPDDTARHQRRPAAAARAAAARRWRR